MRGAFGGRHCGDLGRDDRPWTMGHGRYIDDRPWIMEALLCINGGVWAVIESGGFQL